MSPAIKCTTKLTGLRWRECSSLGNILELVDNGLNNGPFAYQQFIRKVHQMVLDVFAQPGDELESLFKEQMHQGSRNVATIPEQLAAQP
jgi:hypothetical protein